ncbi:ABC transporter ATP-binding protein [Feifania hominis]|uniref:ABC transporter ATP-binding protein n=1 Tax=Feifania hominis TaxID=2763660 RepID=A0A926HUF4_9FIRM|nr:ABC transporter ATP-binding protein [Feifania hominis]MBC8536238.1 ABC transporter ATP-binding protein [Feifania hominis]
MEKQQKLLDIKDLTVVYKTDLEVVRAVNGVNFSVERGKTLGIVGETGAGKTTTSLAIMGLLPERTGKVTAGEILFDGQDLLKLNKTDMRSICGDKISMIFQDPMTALNPTMTIGDQIAEAMELHNHDKLTKAEISKKVEEKLEMVGIRPERKNDYPHQFSGGMKQRVVIAIALACEPELLIADEPTTALDVTIQAQVLAMMNELQQRLGTSMILITHDLGIVAQTCDDVCVMYAGEVIEYGTAEDIFTAKKHHPYTDGLFGSIPNLKVESRRLNPINGLMPDPTNLPEGCHFAPRCPHCMDICKTQHPPCHVDGTHRIACHLYTQEGGDKE